MADPKVKAAASSKEVGPHMIKSNRHRTCLRMQKEVNPLFFFLALQKTMDDKTALELLSGDFSAVAPPPAPVTSSTTKLEPPVLDSEPLKVADEMLFHPS